MRRCMPFIFSKVYLAWLTIPRLAGHFAKVQRKMRATSILANLLCRHAPTPVCQ